MMLDVVEEHESGKFPQSNQKVAHIFMLSSASLFNKQKKGLKYE